MITFIRHFVHYGITPTFLLMAIINFLIERKGGGHMNHMADPPFIDMFKIDMFGHFGLGSMWIMYLLMAIAHISPYLPKKK
ncbi:MAG: hypothetical protein V3U57_06010 [Robiginitomaculum sp.]